jgi:hypothetical protein
MKKKYLLLLALGLIIIASSFFIPIQGTKKNVIEKEVSITPKKLKIYLTIMLLRLKKIKKEIETLNNTPLDVKNQKRPDKMILTYINNLTQLDKNISNYEEKIKKLE